MLDASALLAVLNGESGADKLTLEHRNGREHGDEQAASRGGGIEQRITQRLERGS